MPITSILECYKYLKRAMSMFHITAVDELELSVRFHLTTTQFYIYSLIIRDPGKFRLRSICTHGSFEKRPINIYLNHFTHIRDRSVAFRTNCIHKCVKLKKSRFSSDSTLPAFSKVPGIPSLSKCLASVAWTSYVRLSYYFGNGD